MISYLSYESKIEQLNITTEYRVLGIIACPKTHGGPCTVKLNMQDAWENKKDEESIYTTNYFWKSPLFLFLSPSSEQF